MLRPLFRGFIAAAALGACAGDTLAPPTDAISANPAALAPRADSTSTSRVSLFLHYRADAPADRASRMWAAGASFVFDAEDVRVLALVAPRPALAAFERIPWVETVEVADGPPPRLMGETISWAIDSTGAGVVHLMRGNRGTGVRVGLLDGRVMCNHGDLIDRVVGGTDLVQLGAKICPLAWAADYREHGTKVAGIIAGSRNGTGIVGMAPEADLYVLRVCDDSGSCDFSRVHSALYLVEKQDLRLINMSFAICGGPEQVPHYVRDQIARLYQRGVVMVAAAGNGSLNGHCATGSPVSGLARLPGVFAVTHWLRDGTQNPVFQYGEGVDLAAPTNVPTAVPWGVNNDMHPGTSFAAPHVTGAVALLLHEGFTGPDLILRRLAETATDRGPAGWDDHWGWGTINVARAAVPKPFIRSFGGTEPITEAGQRTITADLINGAPPIAVTWSVSYSDGAAASYTVTGGLSHSVPISEGNYTITVHATPKETVYGRVGPASVVRLAVCASGGGGGAEPRLVKQGTRASAAAQAEACQ